MTQAAERGRKPASFGRQPEPEPEDFKIVGGQAIHLVVHAQVVPDAESLQQLHDAIRSVTAAGVLAGYADAFTKMDEPDAPPAGGERPGDGDGGTSPG